MRPVNMRDDSILWLINRTVFHPRGYALAWDTESGEFSLLGDGTEPWSFSGESETAHFVKIKELMPSGLHNAGLEPETETSLAIARELDALANELCHCVMPNQISQWDAGYVSGICVASDVFRRRANFLRGEQA